MSFIENCGLMLEPQEGMSVDEIVEWARYAEKSGYGYIFRSDHILPISGKLELGSPECWVTLGVLAATTKTIKFGPMVSPIGFRNPAILAKMACTLNSYSRGRLMLSVGAGWYKNEYEAHGIPFPSFGERRRQFSEALQIIRPLTEGKHVRFSGKFFSADTAGLPKPEQKIHLIIGGRNQRIVNLACRFADEINIGGPAAKAVQTVNNGIQSTPPEQRRKVLISQMFPFLIAESEQDLNGKVGSYFTALTSGQQHVDPKTQITKLVERGIPCGVVDDFSNQIKEKKEAGIDRFYFQIHDPKDRDMVEILTKTLRRK